MFNFGRKSNLSLIHILCVFIMYFCNLMQKLYQFYKINLRRIDISLINLIFILFLQPCLPIVMYKRSQESVEDIGTNELVQWKPDSSMLVVAVSKLVYCRSRFHNVGHVHFSVLFFWIIFKLFWTIKFKFLIVC